MLHGLNNSFLYSAYRITSVFANRDGDVAYRGTGFWIDIGDGVFVLVTNRHVVEKDKHQLRELRVSGKRAEGQSDTDVTIEVLKWLVAHSKYPENDIACLYLLEVKDPPARIGHGIPRSLLATKEDFESDLSVCDFVAFPGFPDWYDRRQLRPILRMGVISSDPRYDYSSTMEYEGEALAYEAFSSGGASGSPVFALQKGVKPGEGLSLPAYRPVKLIGINAGHITAPDGTHRGISIMYKSSAILDILARVDAGELSHVVEWNRK